ncbi:hypothetical protein Cgig2_026276 [Carnegiea gigantea]|uniref:Uncharacterized protein n=1 Tax=Carnegiea gigantea TaxID=171969 RepID=A0A9Q1Q5E6_9CARY|nr:hypothetical protein Cgig2_026276 [Carnegiea gigantea]
MDTTSSAQPVQVGGFPYRPEGGPSFHLIEHRREVTQLDRSARLPLDRQELAARSAHGKTVTSATASTPYVTYCRHKGQIDRFLKRGPRSLWQERAPAPPPPRDKECSTEIVTAIVGGYTEEITLMAWKAQLGSVQQILAVDQGRCIAAPTMVFRGEDAPRFASPHNDPLVVEMKITSAIVRQILVDTGSFVDIITWDCLKRLSHPGRDLKVNPTRTIRLLVRFSDKNKFKSLEVDFLVVDIPSAYNAIIGRPTLHRVKAVVAPCLRQLQFKADDGNVGELYWDLNSPRMLPGKQKSPHRMDQRARDVGTATGGEAGKGEAGRSGPRSPGHPSPLPSLRDCAQKSRMW